MVENYPGFPGGITGPELVNLMAGQLSDSGIRVRRERVVGLDYRDGVFRISTDKGVIESDIAVIAAGTEPKTLPPGLADATAANRVYYEISDMLETRQKRIAIIGAGDVAFDFALNLSRKNDVTILNRSTRPKCVPALWERFHTADKVSYVEGIVTERISHDGESVRLNCVYSDDGRREEIGADFVIVAIGRKPNLSFMADGLRKRYRELISAGKLYPVGDVKNGAYRQTAICVGDGVRAAVDIYRRARPGL